MKTNEFKLKEMIEKLSCLETKDEKLDMIWQWSTTRAINRNMFKQLIKNL